MSYDLLNALLLGMKQLDCSNQGDIQTKISLSPESHDRFFERELESSPS